MNIIKLAFETAGSDMMIKMAKIYFFTIIIMIVPNVLFGQQESAVTVFLKRDAAMDPIPDFKTLVDSPDLEIFYDNAKDLTFLFSESLLPQEIKARIELANLRNVLILNSFDLDLTGKKIPGIVIFLYVAYKINGNNSGAISIAQKNVSNSGLEILYEYYDNESLRYILKLKGNREEKESILRKNIDDSSFLLVSDVYTFEPTTEPATGAWPIVDIESDNCNCDVGTDWYFKALNYTNISKASSKTVIVLLESGFNLEHIKSVKIFKPNENKLQEFMKTMSEFSNAGGESNTQHGNKMIGVLAGNSPSFNGVCSECEIWPITTPKTEFMFAEILYRLKTYIENSSGYKFVIISTRGDCEIDPVLKEAIDSYNLTNVPVFFASGNRKNSETNNFCNGSIKYPASSKNTISVASFDYDGNPMLADMYYSEELDLLAPSASSATNDCCKSLKTYSLNRGKFCPFGGTSGATAIAAGAAGLLLSNNPELKGKEVRDILKFSGKYVKFRGNSIQKKDLIVPKINIGNALKPYAQVVFLNGEPEPGKMCEAKLLASAPFGLKLITWEAKWDPKIIGSASISAKTYSKDITFSLPKDASISPVIEITIEAMDEKGSTQKSSFPVNILNRNTP